MIKRNLHIDFAAKFFWDIMNVHILRYLTVETHLAILSGQSKSQTVPGAETCAQKTTSMPLNHCDVLTEVKAIHP